MSVADTCNAHCLRAKCIELVLFVREREENPHCSRH